MPTCAIDFSSSSQASRMTDRAPPFRSPKPTPHIVDPTFVPKRLVERDGLRSSLDEELLRSRPKMITTHFIHQARTRTARSLARRRRRSSLSRLRAGGLRSRASRCPSPLPVKPKQVSDRYILLLSSLTPRTVLNSPHYSPASSLPVIEQVSTAHILVLCPYAPHSALKCSTSWEKAHTRR